MKYIKGTEEEKGKEKKGSSHNPLMTAILRFLLTVFVKQSGMKSCILCDAALP